MAIAPGTRLGPYEVLSTLGAGGMGEVYKARDTRLERIVALKVSRTEFDERFEREARAIATLNHPHICTLHDVGPNYLVMEYIDGTPLEGPLPLEQALKYAAEIADALDAAHRQHIVHRDLKPANILLTKTGVKLLDFGIAKYSPNLKGPAYVPVTALPTEAPLTAQGTILGTMQYMSPEQLQGREADARSDIFAFGLVLYEMLTGRRAFDGTSTASVIGAILERPAPIVQPELLHRGVNRIIATCLAKNPEDRFQTARDLKRSIEWSEVGREPAAREPRAARTWIPWAVATAVCAAILVSELSFGWARPRSTPGPASDLAVTIVPPSASGIDLLGAASGRPEISPDGAFITYHDRTRNLQLRRLNSMSPELVSAGILNTEIWSADSKSLVFSDATNLKRMSVPDGAPETIGRLPGPLLTGTLSDSGTLVFVSILGGTSSSLFTIPPGGGEPKEITLPVVKRLGFGDSRFLPGGEDLLVTVTQGSTENEIYLVTLRGGDPADPVLLMKNAGGVRYTTAGGGRVLFLRNSNLYAQRLNRRTRKLEGEQELVQSDVAQFSVSQTGILVWRSGRPAPQSLTIFDRQGRTLGTAGPASGFLALKLSPNERQLLASSPGQSWLLEPNSPARVNLRQGDITTLWSPDPTRVLVPVGSRIVERPLSGSGEGREVANVPGLARLEDVYGNVVLFTKGAFASAVFSVRLGDTAEDRVPKPVIETGEWVWNTRFSPDGRWIVFQVVGQDRGIYVQEFPGPGLRKHVTSSGEYPVWRKDGKEIVYLDANRIWSVPVDTSGGEFRAGTPTALFPVRPVGRVLDVSNLAVSRDGSRIYFPQAVEQPDSDVIHVRIGWENAAQRPKP
jgi:serine/threonine protein kinase